MSVKSLTKRQEVRNGADWPWEWWFQGKQQPRRRAGRQCAHRFRESAVPGIFQLPDGLPTVHQLNTARRCRSCDLVSGQARR